MNAEQLRGELQARITGLTVEAVITPWGAYAVSLGYSPYGVQGIFSAEQVNGHARDEAYLDGLALQLLHTWVEQRHYRPWAIRAEP